MTFGIVISWFVTFRFYQMLIFICSGLICWLHARFGVRLLVFHRRLLRLVSVDLFFLLPMLTRFRCDVLASRTFICWQLVDYGSFFVVGRVTQNANFSACSVAVILASSLGVGAAEHAVEIVTGGVAMNFEHCRVYR